MDVQKDLLGDPPQFDGKTYDPALDEDRLRTQLGRVYELMLDGDWYQLSWIKNLIDYSYLTNCSEAGISARIRDLRKPKFGNYVIERRRVEGGLWEYRMTGERNE